MEGDTENTKISYLHHWLNGSGISKIKGWKNSKILISQEEYDALEERDRKGKYSLDKVESYFTLCESILTPRSNPLLALEDLHLTKQGSMTSEVSLSYTTNSKKMSVSKPRGRGKSHQGCNFQRYEQPAGKG